MPIVISIFANYHLAPLTPPQYYLLDSVPLSFALLSLSVRSQYSAGCHFVLHLIVLSGMGSNVM